MSLRNSATCSRVGPVSTLVFVVGRVFAFVVVGVRLPFGLGRVVFGFVVGGFVVSGFFVPGIVMLPILICAEALIANVAMMKQRTVVPVTIASRFLDWVFTSHLHCGNKFGLVDDVKVALLYGAGFAVG